MYLKRLELVGFKSFAAKTVLEFPAGTVAVVGPNGSGKSNIIDAIRWLLGEREAKNMRGLKAEDLIFAGTPTRARSSLAQATVVFDNSTHFFPDEHAEISIRRKISRDGESAYLINDAEVRLKDVVDFFAKSRLGTRGFSIINQGESDLFVRALPRERRAMIEEILGLRQYQLKKHDAQLKLKATSVNMDKARALRDELLPHLKLLRKQANKWAQHDELVAELAELEKNYFSAKLAGLARERAHIAPDLASLDAQTKERERVLKELAKALAGVEAGAGSPAGHAREDFGRELAALWQRRSAVERELGKLEARAETGGEVGEASPFDPKDLVALLEESRQVVEDALAEEDVEVVKTLLTELLEKISHTLDAEPEVKRHDVHDDLSSARAALTKELGELDTKTALLRQREAKAAEQLSGFNEAFRAAFSAVEAKKEEIAAIEAKRAARGLDLERIQLRHDELRRYAELAGRKLEEFTPRAAGGEPFDFVQGERRMLRLRGELAAIGEVDQAVLAEAKETETRYEFLARDLGDLEKAHADLTGLIRDLDRTIHEQFTAALHSISQAFDHYFTMMFGGGHGKLALEKATSDLPTGQAGRRQDGESGNEEVSQEKLEEDADAEHAIDHGGIEISVSIPRKRITGLDMLSGGERALTSIAALFALISVSPPPFLVLDEVDAALDEANTKRFADLVKDFSKKTQFLVVTHNRATMEAADILYGITMGQDGVSKVLSLKLA